MPKIVKKANAVQLWDGIGKEDFLSENFVEEQDIVEFNMPRSINFIGNINLMRQLPRLSDSLKPVERRILIQMYKNKVFSTSKSYKSNKILGFVMDLHAHGDGSVYKTLVGMAQSWSKAVPLIRGIGNFGSASNPKIFASPRYTEVTLSKYAEDCFFSDYDADCIEVIHNTASDGPEPLSLPNKYPNILVNGGTGIAVGNAYAIPPFNLKDIVDLCKRLMKNPMHPDTMIFPDSPTGCDIVDDGTSIRSIVETGTGTLIMRSTIDIIEGKRSWILKIKNVPWMVNPQDVMAKLVELTKKKILPVTDVQDHCYQIKTKRGIETVIDIEIHVDKAHDPYVTRNKIFKNTQLQKPLPTNFKIVTDNLEVDQLGLRELIVSWIDGRREYKRRILNQKISKLTARMQLLDVLIRVTNKDTLNKTIEIIRTSNGDEAVDRLVKLGKMSSFQAAQLIEMSMRAFTKEMNEKYQNEKKSKESQLDNVLLLVRSEKKIDEIISEELDDLLKYIVPGRARSRIIHPESGVQVSDSDHTLIVTKQNFIKKLPLMGDKMNFGSFKNYDYPICMHDAKNLDEVMFFDSTGRFTNMPVHEIDNTSTSSTGLRSFDVTKLSGNIISMMPSIYKSSKELLKVIGKGDPTIMTLTKDGYFKATKLDEFLSTKNQKNVRAMKIRPEDALIYAEIVLANADIVIYTKKGNYTFIHHENIPIASKDAQGLQAIKLEDGDECVGLSIIGKRADYILVVTAKGMVKKCERGILGEAGKRRVGSTYLVSLDHSDSLVYAGSIDEDGTATVCTRLGVTVLKADEIPTATRRSKGSKLVPVPLGSNIVRVEVR